MLDERFIGIAIDKCFQIITENIGIMHSRDNAVIQQRRD